MIYLDSPAFVGFSYSETKEDRSVGGWVGGRVGGWALHVMLRMLHNVILTP